MIEVNQQALIDTTFRALTLLGIATVLISNYEKKLRCHPDEEKCKWFLNAVNAVVYENKPLPPMP